MPGFTQWSPDTCGCVININNDDQSFHSSVTLCPKHATFTGAAHLTKLLGHNRNKNDIANWLEANADTLGLNKIALPEGGALRAQFLANYDFNAPEDSDPLRITGHNLPAGKKATLQAAADQRYGAGKILIV